jgi:hypothetical protein
MRRTILALTVIFCAPTAVMAFTAGRTLGGDSESGATGAAIQHQIAPGGIAGNGHEGFLRGNVILAKGDQKGDGGGHGGHPGKHLGKGDGKQKESKAAKAGGGGQPGGAPAPRR